MRGWGDCQTEHRHRATSRSRGQSTRRPNLLRAAPCSAPYKAWPGDADVVESEARRPALTFPARAAPEHPQAGRRNGLMARTKELHSPGESDDIVSSSCRGLREDETIWRTSLPGACEPW